MKYVLIRDDDISYFTKPKSLKKLYSSFFNEKKPINFAVIPKINANIKIDPGNPYQKWEHLEYDPIIPPKYRGATEDFPLNDNREIVEFIKSIDSYEVLQHGFTHGLINGVKEFRIRDKEVLQKKLNDGKEILQKCFHTDTSFFVAPWDNMSLEAISLLKSSYKGLSIGRINPARLPSKTWASYLRKILFSKNYLFCEDLFIIEHSGFILTRFSNPEFIINQVKNVIKTKDIIILVNHHWEYFYDWNELDSSFFGAWEKVADYILKKEDLEIITFSELYNIIKEQKI